MKIYGAGSIEDIKKCTELGVAGILTNPQGFEQYYKGELTLTEITKAILDVSDTPVFIQVHGPNADAIVDRAVELRKLSDRVCAKIIADEKGFEAIACLQKKGIDCIATCLFSVSQAAVAAMVGAYGICPFVSRAREEGIDMFGIISGIKKCYREMEHAPEIFAVSMKGIADVDGAFLAGTDAVALRYPLLQKMMGHVLTHRAEALFAKNWANVKGEDVEYMRDKIKLEGIAE
ncbi:MAG TPA: transaldolase family protein [Feifaniaceae bacterium]|nr:transaldolase family protein [Feifaniaceae bacterium]